MLNDSLDKTLRGITTPFNEIIQENKAQKMVAKILAEKERVNIKIDWREVDHIVPLHEMFMKYKATEELKNFI